MLCHDSVLMNAKIIDTGISDIRKEAEVTVSYLPLNHIAAQIFDGYMGLDNGSCIYFADRDAMKGTLVKTFLKARPTCLFGVPRVFEKMQERLKQVTANSSTFSRSAMEWARRVTLAYHQNKT